MEQSVEAKVFVSNKNPMGKKMAMITLLSDNSDALLVNGNLMIG